MIKNMIAISIVLSSIAPALAEEATKPVGAPAPKQDAPVAAQPQPVLPAPEAKAGVTGKQEENGAERKAEEAADAKASK